MPKYSESPVDHDIKLWMTHILSGASGSGQVTHPRFPVSDLERTLHLAQTEGLAALLSHTLNQEPHSQELPVEFLDRLKDLELQSAALNLRRELEIKRVLELFQVAGLEFIVLKGEALAYRLYPFPHLRSRCDTDLLFKDKSDTEKVWSILQQQGYVRRVTLEGEFVGFQYSSTRTLASGLTITFDIHNQISDYLWFANRYPFEELLNNSEVMIFSGLEVRCLDNTYALMHACLHRIGNKPHGIENRLIWLYDIFLLANALTEKDWAELVNAAAKKDMSKVCFDGLAIANSSFGTPAPKSVMAKLSQAAEGEEIGLSNIDSRWRLYVMDFFANKGFRNKCVQLKEHVLPSAGYMMNKYSSTSRFLLPYFYVKRIVQGLVKYK